MKDMFSLARFTRLFIKHTVEHYKSYLMSVLVLLGTMLLGGGFIVYMLGAPMKIGMQTALFTSILLLAGTIFTSTVFAGLGDKKKAIVWLTLPASHFEKYLVLWLYSFLFLVIIFTGCFYTVLFFLTSIKHFPNEPTEILDLFGRRGLGQIFLFYAFLHAVALYGAIRFEKLHFIKTAFIFFIGLTLLIIINHLIQYAMLGKGILMNVPFGGAAFIENNQPKIINITVAQERHILTLIAVLAGIFWVAAFFRLKEKQV